MGGRGSSRELPAGTVAILMGDVEGSTVLWERDAAEARSAIRSLEAIVADIAGEHAGVAPADQGEGDNLVLAFETASSAIAAALDLQVRVTTALPVRVRVAVHAGDIEVWDRRRYAGATMNRAARLRDAAHGGQVLVSSPARELAIASGLPDGADLVELGRYELRGIDEPQLIFQLVHADIAPVFPPLRADAGRDRLPSPLTSFVGRESERDDVDALLAANRLVTVVGPGGSGKTRLAIELARIRQERGAQVAFAAIADATPDVVAHVIAAAVRARPAPGTAIVQGIAAQVATGAFLLVIDNAEHVIEVVASLAEELLESARTLRLLVTSREPLRAAGESVFRLAPLDEADAAALFRARAESVASAVPLDDVATIRRVCAQLDWLPLPIELAAARLTSMSLGELEDALADRFAVLDRGPRTAAARQRTLQASVEWSHDLLSDSERVALRRLSVFAGGFDRRAGAAVIGSDAGSALESLIAKSLVAVDGGGRRTRFRLLQTIRQFAAAQLALADEVVAARAAHLAYYAARADELLTNASRDRAESLDELRHDLDNITEAVHWAATGGDGVTGLRLAAPAFIAWWTSARLEEGARALTALLEATPDGPADLRAWALWGRGTLTHFLSPTAMTDLNAAVDLARAAAERRVEAGALATLGLAWSAFGHGDEAVVRTDEALAIARSLDDEFLLSYVLFTSGSAAMSRADRVTAAGRFEEGLVLARRSGLPVYLHAIPLAQARTVLGDLAETERLLAEGLPLAYAANDWTWVLNGEALAFQTAVNRGRIEEAESALSRLEAVPGAEMQPFVRRTVAHGRATLQLSAGNYDAAASTALAILDEEPGKPIEAANIWHVVSLARHYAGDADGAEAALRRTKELADGLTHVAFRMYLLVGDANVALSRGDAGTAGRALVEAFELLSPHEPFSALNLLEVAVAVREAQGRVDEAARIKGAVSVAYAEAELFRPPSVGRAALEQRLRDRLADRYDELFAEGARMAVDEAVEYARRSTGPRKRPVAGWESLTPMERQTAEFAAQGLTNKEIGERLFISSRTAGTHLQRAYAKLQLRSRTELAAAVARRDTAPS